VAKTRTNLLSVPSSAASGAPGRSVIIPFSFSKYKNIWIYIFTSPVTAESKLKRTVAFSMCLFTEVGVQSILRVMFVDWITCCGCLVVFSREIWRAFKINVWHLPHDKRPCQSVGMLSRRVYIGEVFQRFNDI